MFLHSSSSCHAISTDIPKPLSPPLPIVHCFRQVLRATSRIGTELLYVGSSWSSCLCSSMWRGPQEYITYEMSRMSGSYNFCSFRDGWLMAVQLVSCGMMPPRPVQYYLQHSWVVAAKYCYLTLIFLFIINYLFVDADVVSYSCDLQSFFP